MAYKKFSTTKATALSVAASASATSIDVVDGSSYPDPAIGGNGPYTLLLAYGSDREEIVTVTAKPSANTFTVTRGQDGSAATVKNIGDIVVHGVSKRDWEDMAPLASPALTGTPTAPTAAAGTSTTQLATTAFVTTADNLKANIASPTFTGDPKAPTPAAGDNDTSIATTAFVQQQMPIGAIIAYGGNTAPTGWHLCDGSAHGSSALQAVTGSANAPDLRGRFIVGVGDSTHADVPTVYARGDIGGKEAVPLTTANMPSHSHGGGTGSASATHDHGGLTGTTNTDHSHPAGLIETWWAPMPGSGTTRENIQDTQTGGLVASTTGGMNQNATHNHTISSASATHNHTINSEGSGTSHENRPPYYALTYIVKKA